MLLSPKLKTWNWLFVEVMGVCKNPAVRPPKIFNRPPDKVPPPSSEIMSKTKATLLAFNGVTSMLLRTLRMLASTKRCSMANRLPPPWLGIPVIVPQPVVRNTAAVAKAIERRAKESTMAHFQR